MKNFGMMFLILSAISCSSNSKDKHKDIIIARIDDLTERPSWFKESEDTELRGEEIIFWGRSTLKNNERLEIGYKIAELNAKSRIANFVSEKVKAISQSADEVNTQDQSIFRSIITQKSKVKLSEIRSGKKYWEKVETSDPRGERGLEYRVFQSVIIKKNDLAKLVKEALLEGQGKFSEGFREKVEQEFNHMVNEETHEIR